MADAHLAPALGVNRDVVERATHVARPLVGVDVDDVAATSGTAAVIRPLVGLVPAPAVVKELGRDVPVPHFSSATEVAGDAVDPRATT